MTRANNNNHYGYMDLIDFKEKYYYSWKILLNFYIFRSYQ